jgi:hypothetical protein
MSKRGYLLDTGVFIESHRRYWYGLDICPGFWEALLHFEGVGRVCSLDRVRDEITEGDELAAWIAEAPDTLFASTADAKVAEKYAEIVEWVEASDFTDAAKADFASGADGWLVAHASVHGLVVVTHESHQAERKNKVKVPNACEEFGVEWEDTFGMLRHLEVKFDWNPSP